MNIAFKVGEISYMRLCVLELTIMVKYRRSTRKAFGFYRVP